MDMRRSSCSSIVSIFEKFDETEKPVAYDDFITIKDVRLRPAKMDFINAIEGKVFRRKLVIQNCGRNAVTLRIGIPSSSSVQIKSCLQGQKLLPGLQLIRMVNYTFSYTSASMSATIPIHVDDEEIDYNISVDVSKAELIATPPIIDFGTIDAGPSLSKRTFTLSNNGVKSLKFVIDLGLNPMQMNVQPMKGYLHGFASIEVSVELTAMNEGCFTTEFWIKTEHPVCIPVKLQVFIGTLEIYHINTTPEFTLIHFPITYYGLRSYETFIIKNSSSVEAVYYVMGEINNNSEHLSKAKDMDPNFNYFRIEPEGGRLYPMDGKPFICSFKPKKNAHPEEFSLVIMRILKLYCKDISKNMYEDTVFLSNSGDQLKLPGQESNTSMNSMDSLDVEFFESKETLTDIDLKAQTNLFFTSTARIILYGEVESPAVTLTPDELTLLDMKLKKRESRVCIVTNKSKRMPIFFRYKKTAYITVSPKQGFLKPFESMEVSIFITPTCYGVIETNIQFDLLFYHQPREVNETLQEIDTVSMNVFLKIPSVTKFPPGKFNLGITPNYIKEVGFNVEKVTFSSDIEKPRQAMLSMHSKASRGDEIIAFPNDMPKSLRPWINTKRCKTIFTNLPRVNDYFDEYTMSGLEKKLKAENIAYYTDFIRTKGAELRKLQEKRTIHFMKDYDIAASDRCTGLYSNNLQTQSVKEPDYIPLTPVQIYNVIITPRNIFIDKIVPYSSFEKYMNVINNNDCAIRIYLKPQSDVFTFPAGNRYRLKAFSEINIKYIYYASCEGTHNNVLDLIVNENNIFETTFTVVVVPKLPIFSNTTIEFSGNNLPIQYLQISNILNSPIKFNFESTSSLIIEPISGEIHPNKKLTCYLSYDVAHTSDYSFDCKCRLDSKRLQTLKIFIKALECNVEIDDQIDFGNIAVNLLATKEVTIRNLSGVPTYFKLAPAKIEGLTITPSSGVIPQHGYQILKLNVLRNILGPFECGLDLTMGQILKSTYTVSVKGNIGFPHIEVYPDCMRFRKMPASSFDIKSLTLKNNSNVEALVFINLEDFPDLSICNSIKDDVKITEAFTMQPYQVIELYLYYDPIEPSLTSIPLPIEINNCKEFKKSNSQLIDIPTTRITTSTQSHKLLISNDHCEFVYFPYFNFASCTESVIIIKNVSKFPINICIRLDNILDSYFLFEYLCGGDVSENECSTVVMLEADAESTFKVTFNPLERKEYRATLPFYIKDDFVEDVHNKIYLRGIYHAAEIKANMKTIYYAQMPLCFKVEKTLQLTLEYHSPNCDLSISSNSDSLSIVYAFTGVKGIETIVDVSLTLYSYDSEVVKNMVCIDCCCGGSLEIPVIGVIENYLVTNYMCINYFKTTFDTNVDDIFKHKNSASESAISLLQDQQDTKFHYKTNFPFYPTPDLIIYNHMENTIKAVEQWMYEEGFYGLTYYKIPDTMNVCSIEKQEALPSSKRTKGVTHAKTNAAKMVLPYMQLLTNLGVNNIYQQEGTEEIPKDPILFIVYKHSIYESAVKYLTDQQGSIPHVLPEYLLTYEDYQLYIRFINPNNDTGQYEAGNPLPFDQFYLLSKQCWLDMILQTFKILVWIRVQELVPLRNECVDSKSIRRSLNMSDICIKTLEPPTEQSHINNTIYSNEAMILLSWLKVKFLEQQVYMQERWGPLTDKAGWAAKDVCNFDTDISDGVMFTALTLSYCPFLKQHLSTIYIQPNFPEEKFHNACVLVRAWALLNISFKLCPQQITQPNPVQIVMFIANMYSFLPCFQPTETIKITVPLSQTGSGGIHISNTNQCSASYDLFFFGNDDNCFTIKNKHITIQPGKSMTLHVNFFAKYMKIQKVTLILCGEVLGNKFANSKAYNMEGIPDISAGKNVIQISSPIYEIRNVKIKVQSPYITKAEYSIYYSLSESNTIENLAILPYEQFLTNNILSRAYFDGATITTNEEGLVISTILICTITAVSRHLYLYYKNAEVGDFMCELILKPTPAKIYETINVQLPSNFKEMKCSCRKAAYKAVKCPKYVTLQIPSKNYTIWNVVIKLFFLRTNLKEFWSRYINTKVGMAILRRMMHDSRALATPDMLYLFTKSMNYILKSKLKEVTIPRNLQILNLRSESCIDVVMHVNVSHPKQIKLCYQSENLLEHRNYKLNFNYSDSNHAIHN